jgi:uncharacterized membrane protein HdeD (DUF308 family)
MNLLDIGGVTGVLMMLFAYAAAQVHRLDPTKAPSLLMNFFGSCLVLASLCQTFNLSAALMEGAWALVALFGLIRLILSRR